MIGTEEQAREWWCPMARVIPVLGDDADAKPMATASNRVRYHGMTVRDVLSPASCRCIAARCAMWVWDDWAHESVPLSQDTPDTPPPGDGWTHFKDTLGRTFWRRPFPDRQGSCGLSKGGYS